MPNPRHVFERLFGTGETSADPQAAARRARYRQSILDGVVEETRLLKSNVGDADRRRIDEYLTSIREVERGIQKAQSERPAHGPTIERPPGVPADHAEHARLMFEFLALAFQADSTRITTMMIGRESSIRSYDQPRYPRSAPSAFASPQRSSQPRKLTRIQTYHIGLFAEFIAKLRTISDGDGSLLDHSLILYGAGIADSNRHTHEKLPILLVGKGNGSVKTGRHLDLGKDTPVANVLLAMLDRAGVRPERLGDSTGVMEI